MLLGIDHVNLVVDDLPGMVAFYRDILGLRVSKEVTIQGAWVDRVVGLEGACAEVVYLELAEGPRVELIRYVAPPGPRPEGLGLSHCKGIRHIAFRVDDIDKVVRQLTMRKVRFLSDVGTVPDSQVTYAGGVRKRLVYFRDPENNILELCCYK
jgi:catechol 2,3-dioxygenase-like lactoylglutathione lyase family enzyme